MKKILQIPWYPFLFTAYPVLALLAYNIAEVKFTAGIRPLVLSTLAALALFLLLRLAYRNLQRAALATAALALLFLSYGQVYDQIFKKWKVPHLSVWLLGIWLVLAALALAGAAFGQAKIENAALLLNSISLVLVIFSVVQVAWWSLQPAVHTSGAKYAPQQRLHVPPGSTPPDIYYIILDSYGRLDLLQQAYAYDNLPFIQHLAGMGFYVAGCSQSNYVRTELSFGSSLNMSYLQGLDPTFSPSNQDRSQLWNSIRYSAVRRDLEKAGYRTVAFATGFAWSEIDNADVYFGISPLWSGMTGFETLMLRTTPARHLQDIGVLNFDEIDGQRYRQRTLQVFDRMEELAHMPGPKFVFIHVVSPHPPFVFGPDGTPTDPAPFLNQDRIYTAEKYAQGYVNQVTFLNQKVEQAVATLIGESSTPPVIILQGDHGPWIQTGSNQFKILNAYYLPGHRDQLYPSVSPVNTFRIILDSYLGADYKLLEDVSYYSPVPYLYNFTKVPNPCQDH